MPYDKIFEVLESIGLKQNEILIYIDLLKSGKSSASDIAKRTNLHRSNTYDILLRLLDRGIVDETTEEDKKFYFPIDPSDLFDYLKQKEHELEEIIPKLEEIQKTTPEDRKVTISKGINSVKNILTHMLDFKETICSHGTPKEAIEMLGAWLDEFHRQRVKKKIIFKKIYGIDDIQRMKKLNQMDFTESRYLSSYNPRVTTLICGNKVILIIWESPITTIIIQSQTVAEAYQQYFERLWDEAIENP